jgi:23S rRNA pseudouridine2605 synthase
VCPWYLLCATFFDRLMASGFSRKAVSIMEAKPERLQKILAASGLASRRKAEQLIAAGIVSVNGHVITEPGTKADPRIDEIRVDGKLLRGPERHVYLAVYKPKGHMTTVSDPEGRPTVMDLLKGIDERVFPVGRLDYMSEGLLLLTNDGDLMAELTKAGSHVAKTYMVKVSGKPTEEEIDKLRNGIMLPPEPGLTNVRGKKQPGVERRSFAILTQPAAIQLAVDQENPWYEVTLTEGRNRQIRRMFEQIGYHIEKIKRVRYGSLTLDIEPGEFRHLTPKEVTQLRKSLDTPFKPKPIKVKRKDARPERAPRVDAARFVKGRRGKPSADAPAPSPIVRRATTTRSPAPPRREFSSPAEGGERSNFTRPRGPEFGRDSVRRDDGIAAKRSYTRKPAGELSPKPSGDFAERPKRSYTRPAGSFDRKSSGSDRKPGSFARKPAGDFAKREGGYTKRAPANREAGFDAPEKRDTSKTGGFGFSKFAKPRFVKPSKHRDLGSDKTDNFEPKPLGERKPFSAERPYSKPAGDRGFDKKPGGFTSDRKYSKGPGKPTGYAPRTGGDFKPRAASGDFKPRSTGDFKPRTSSSDFKRPGGDYKPRTGGSSDFKRPGGDYKRSGEGRSSTGSFGKSSGTGRSSSGGAGGRPSGGAGFGAKRTGFGPPRSGGGDVRRPSGPPRGGRPSGPPRRRPDSE